MSHAISSITVHFATSPPVRELASGCGQKRIIVGSIRTEATYDSARTLDKKLVLSSIQYRLTKYQSRISALFKAMDRNIGLVELIALANYDIVYLLLVDSSPVA